MMSLSRQEMADGIAMAAIIVAKRENVVGWPNRWLREHPWVDFQSLVNYARYQLEQREIARRYHAIMEAYRRTVE